MRFALGGSACHLSTIANHTTHLSQPRRTPTQEDASSIICYTLAIAHWFAFQPAIVAPLSQTPPSLSLAHSKKAGIRTCLSNPLSHNLQEENDGVFLGLFLIEPSISHPSHWLPLARDRDRQRCAFENARFAPHVATFCASIDREQEGRVGNDGVFLGLFLIEPSAPHPSHIRTAARSRPRPPALRFRECALRTLCRNLLCFNRQGTGSGGWETMAFSLVCFSLNLPPRILPTFGLPRTRTPSQPAAIAATDAQPEGRRQTSLEKKTLFPCLLLPSGFGLGPRPDPRCQTHSLTPLCWMSTFHRSSHSQPTSFVPTGMYVCNSLIYEKTDTIYLATPN